MNCCLTILFHYPLLVVNALSLGSHSIWVTSGWMAEVFSSSLLDCVSEWPVPNRSCKAFQGNSKLMLHHVQYWYPQNLPCLEILQVSCHHLTTEQQKAAELVLVSVKIFDKNWFWSLISSIKQRKCRSIEGRGFYEKVFKCLKANLRCSVLKHLKMLSWTFERGDFESRNWLYLKNSLEGRMGWSKGLDLCTKLM